jgi:hypothetical protein
MVDHSTVQASSYIYHAYTPIPASKQPPPAAHTPIPVRLLLRDMDMINGEVQAKGKQNPMG